MNNTALKKLLIVVIVLTIFTQNSMAQCAMCRAVLETQEGSTIKGEALNDGIVYLMAFPYLLVGILGFIIYKTNKKRKAKKL